MKSKFNLLLLAILFGINLSSYAQMGMGKIEEIEAVQQRKLIVMIEEPREKMLDKLNKNPKRGSVEEYKTDLAVFNENMKAVVEKFWAYNKDGIQYLTFDEIEALRKKGEKGFAVLTCISVMPKKQSWYHREGLSWKKDIKDDFEDREDMMFTSMTINKIEDFGKLPVYNTALFDIFPSKAALVYGVKNIIGYFDYRIRTKKNGEKQSDINEEAMKWMQENAPLLENKTLLIRKEWLGKGVTEDNLKNFYPYKYQVCDRQFMDDVVMKEDAAYAYAVEMPQVIPGGNMNGVIYMQFVMDGAHSRAMCFVVDSDRNFTAKTFKAIVSQVKQFKK